MAAIFKNAQGLEDHWSGDYPDRHVAECVVRHVHKPVKLAHGLFGPALALQFVEILRGQITKCLLARAFFFLFVVRIDALQQKPLGVVARLARFGERDQRIGPDGEDLLLPVKFIGEAPLPRASGLYPQLQTAPVRKLPDLGSGLGVSALHVGQFHFGSFLRIQTANGIRFRFRVGRGATNRPPKYQPCTIGFCGCAIAADVCAGLRQFVSRPKSADNTAC